MMPTLLWLWLFGWLCASGVAAVDTDEGSDRIFHNHFAVHISNASSADAVDQIATKHGFRNMGQVRTTEPPL